MNVPSILAFLQELVDNRDLQIEFAREVMGKDPDEAATAVAGLGARRGYAFPPSDALMARRVLQDLAARTSGTAEDDSDELQDQELGSITGGVSGTAAAMTLGLGDRASQVCAIFNSW